MDRAIRYLWGFVFLCIVFVAGVWIYDSKVRKEKVILEQRIEYLEKGLIYHAEELNKRVDRLEKVVLVLAAKKISNVPKLYVNNPRSVSMYMDVGDITVKALPRKVTINEKEKKSSK